jgi:hypothetical protein
MISYAPDYNPDLNARPGAYEYFALAKVTWLSEDKDLARVAPVRPQ